jgi:hypothetical protein
MRFFDTCIVINHIVKSISGMPEFFLIGGKVLEPRLMFGYGYMLLLLYLHAQVSTEGVSA